MDGLAFTHPGEPPANPVRNPGQARAGRTVQIQVTPFAGVAGHQLLTLFDPTPAEAARRLLARLDLRPAQLQVRAQALGDLAVLRRMPADAAEEFKPGTVQPAAFVDGLTLEELAGAIADLEAADAFAPRRDLAFFTIAELAEHCSGPIRGAVTHGGAIAAPIPEDPA